MKEHIFFILSASIFDSLATTQQIIIFVLMFTTFNPIKNALSYITGLIGAYFLCGFLGYKILDQLKSILEMLFPTTSKMPDNTYYKIQLFTGLIFIIIGCVYYHKKKNSLKPTVENIIILKLKNMNLFVAFCIGVFISVSSFPFSIPYLAVLSKLALLNLTTANVTYSLLFYNLGYALPMIIIFFIYFFMQNGINNSHDHIHKKARQLNLKLTTWVFIAMGCLSLVDSIVFFLLGHPIIKTRLL